MNSNKWRCCSGKSEREIIREKKNDPISFRGLFRFASNTDVILIAVSITACVIHGVCLPITVILFGDLAKVLVDTTDPGLNSSEISNSSMQCQYSSSSHRISPAVK